MSLVTIAHCRALIDAPIADGRLQEIIDREEAYIIDKIGAPYISSSAPQITEILRGGCASVFTKRRIDNVVSVTDYTLLSSTTGTALIEGTTFFLFAGQGRIQRLGATAFGERVDIIYIPRDEREKRRQCIIDLVRLSLARPALQSESVGGEFDYESLDNYEGERQNIMRRLTLNRF